MPREHSYKYTASNLVAFENVLSNVIRLGIPNFLYASSSSVYGNSKKGLLSEDDKGIAPISYYGATKLANEFAAAAMVRGTDTKARGLRFFTVYGPWGRPDMAYFRLINSALNGGSFTLYGDGEALRDFTYIGDIVHSMRELDWELLQHESGFSDVVNIGGGRPVSMTTLINKIEVITGRKIEIIKKSIHRNDVHKTMADTSKIRKLTEQSPEISIEMGLRDTIAWSQDKERIFMLPKWITSVPDAP
jgi:UDP-glucuronate 4-epimerase